MDAAAEDKGDEGAVEGTLGVEQCKKLGACIEEAAREMAAPRGKWRGPPSNYSAGWKILRTRGYPDEDEV
jgi:hypothetical protein